MVEVVGPRQRLHRGVSERYRDGEDELRLLRGRVDLHAVGPPLDRLAYLDAGQLHEHPLHLLVQEVARLPVKRPVVRPCGERLG